MKKSMMFAAILIVSQPLTHGAFAQAASVTISEEDRKAIAIPIENYIQAHATGNGSLMLKAFHKDLQLQGVDNRGYFTMSGVNYARQFSGKPEPDEALRKRTYEIITVFGNTAMVRVTLDYPKVKYTDNMALLKINGEWKITNKSFQAERR
jgi:Putative lumazine-binding